MRILLAVSQWERNGAAIYARRVLPMLEARGHHVWLAAWSDSWIAKETAGSVELLDTRFARWPLTELRRVADFCHRERIDVVHSHLTRAANFCALLRILHGVRSAAHAHSNHFQPHWWAHDRVIAVSRATLRAHRSRLAGLGRSGQVLHNFVDTVRFSPAGEREDRLRPLISVAPGTPVVVQLGEISPRKGVLYTLQAAAHLRAAHPQAHFVFIGKEHCDEDYRRAIKEAAAVSPGNVHWLGRREDVAELLPHATVAVMPSLAEPFALAALEAMACGVPLVTSRVGGFPEMMAEGESGLLVPPKNGIALASALDALLVNKGKAQAMGKAARARVMELFSPEAHVQQLERILAEAASR